jgi:lycopene beta-cyclase
MRPALIECDIAIVGGGLAGGLIALALAAKRPELRVTIIEAGKGIGGNHIWSFFDSDIAAADRWLVDPLICHGWSGYDVAFPGHGRTLDARYNSIESERLDECVRAALPANRLVLGRDVATIAPGQVRFPDGEQLHCGAVIDARGIGDVTRLELGWQKFVGKMLHLKAQHNLTRPMVMDATVQQIDGYRFVYCLPFGPDRLFVEDTYYSEDPTLDQASVSARIDDYAAQHGWQVEAVERIESGVLPVAMGGDFDNYWRAKDGIPKAGMRAGLFHPTTGYSLPDAVRLASHIAGLADLGAVALHDSLHRFARSAWDRRGYYRLLDRMLFRAAEPAERYRIFERFYRLDAGLIGRFYAGQSTAFDKVRILAGKPPVPVGRALRAMKEQRV